MGGESNPLQYTVEDVPFRLESPTKIGNEFQGWFDGENRKTETLGGDPLNIGDKVLTARWVPKIYTATFTDEEGNVYARKRLAYGSVIEKPGSPVKLGWLFKTWREDIPLTMPASDVTVTALFYKVVSLRNAEQEYDYIEGGSGSYGQEPTFFGKADGKEIEYDWDNTAVTDVGTYRVPVLLKGDFYRFSDGSKSAYMEITVNRVTTLLPDSDAEGEVSGDFTPETTFKIVTVTDEEKLIDAQTKLDASETLDQWQIGQAYRFETNYEGELPVQLKLKYGAELSLKVAILSPNGEVKEIDFTYAKDGENRYLIFKTDARNTFMLLEEKPEEDQPPVNLTWLWATLGCVGGVAVLGAVAATALVISKRKRH